MLAAREAGLIGRPEQISALSKVLHIKGASGALGTWKQPLLSKKRPCRLLCRATHPRSPSSEAPNCWEDMSLLFSFSNLCASLRVMLVPVVASV